jgi:hypothetical protein
MTAQAADIETTFTVLTGENFTMVGWSTGRVHVDEIREYKWTAPHHTKTRQFARMDDMWYSLCWKCGGSGNIGYGPDNGICYECAGHGVTDYWSDGEEFETKLRNIARSVKAESTKQRKAFEKREAEIAAWRTANPELVAWAEALTPSGKEEMDYYVQIEDTEEAAQTPRHRSDRLAETAVLDDGRHWAQFVIESEVFDLYSARIQEMIRSIRYGSCLEAQSTAYLRAVVRNDDTAAQAERAAATRHAAEVPPGAKGPRMTISGKVVKIENRCDGEYLFVKVEGQGADTGITWVTNTSSKSAWDLEENQLVTVKATIKRNEVYKGIRSDRVGVAVFTPVDEIPAAPVATAPETPQQAPAQTPAPTVPASEPKAPQGDAKPARRTGRREALGASSVDGWELLYDKPKAGAEVVRQDSRYALACKTHKTLHHLDRLSDEGKIRKAGGWCTECP